MFTQIMAGIGILTLVWWSFTNGMVTADVDRQRREDYNFDEDGNPISFAEAWDAEVGVDEGEPIRCFLMKTFYIIPTVISWVFSHKQKSACKE